MPSKKKFANTDIKGVVKNKNFVWKRVDKEEFHGNIALIDIKEVNEEWSVPRNDGRKDCILNKNYKWLEIYPDNENYAITAMYNEKEEVVEFYIDIIKESGIENGQPYIIDMYLDLIITYENEKYVLDEEELEEALKNKLISQNDFDIAQKTLKYLLDKYESEKEFEKLVEFSLCSLQELKKEINKL